MQTIPVDKQRKELLGSRFLGVTGECSGYVARHWCQSHYEYGR